MADIADGETKVNGDGVGRSEFDRGADEFLEARLLDADLILTGRQRVGDVLAIGVGNGFAVDACGFVLDEDSGVGDGGAGLVGDLAGNGAVGTLCEYSKGECDESEKLARHRL